MKIFNFIPFYIIFFAILCSLCYNRLIKKERSAIMPLSFKLEYLRFYHPEILEILRYVVPDLLKNPDNPSEEDLGHYNFWIDALDEDEAQPLYHFL